jgi:hypothetical protein
VSSLGIWGACIDTGRISTAVSRSATSHSSSGSSISSSVARDIIRRALSKASSSSSSRGSSRGSYSIRCRVGACSSSGFSRALSIASIHAFHWAGGCGPSPTTGCNLLLLLLLLWLADGLDDQWGLLQCQLHPPPSSIPAAMQHAQARYCLKLRCRHISLPRGCRLSEGRRSAGWVGRSSRSVSRWTRPRAHKIEPYLGSCSLGSHCRDLASSWVGCSNFAKPLAGPSAGSNVLLRVWSHSSGFRHCHQVLLLLLLLLLLLHLQLRWLAGDPVQHAASCRCCPTARCWIVLLLPRWRRTDGLAHQPGLCSRCLTTISRIAHLVLLLLLAGWQLLPLLQERL